jgi:hypothetical protein
VIGVARRAEAEKDNWSHLHITRIEVTDVRGWSPEEITRLNRHLSKP